ncbi:IS110 family transposase [Arthrobacter livingstonensis]|uniref:IS110 family transposase n=1 Tax=Arthrobacter livingstonensis TaxID=670078 RepID=A0A2V5LRJ3_9MICC|nr:IS110 family transposase [Arthrobacter livingstonensis]PYI65467.1 IS110 family transposase [Arthrobacter livingstonensis]
MSIVRDEYKNIVGVDTHAQTNTYAILAAVSGQVVDTATFPTSPPGLKRAIAWIHRRSEPGKTLVAIEGTNSYGSGLTRALRQTELDFCEVRPPRRTSRAGRGKSDDIDALAAARTVLGEQVGALLDPRAEGNREALRILLNARDAMERQGTSDRLILTALLRTMDLGIDARKALTDTQVLEISRWRTLRREDLQTRTARAEAKRLATAINQFQVQLVQNREQLQEVVDLMAAGLMDLPGLGPVTAAQVIVSYSHHGRVRSEAAFAALAGVNPIPASSGNNVRYRLNRHGDRQLNRALHTIARSRMMFDAETKAYVARRTAEGKGIKEIRRCLKRFIARQLFRKLQTLLT